MRFGCRRGFTLIEVLVMVVFCTLIVTAARFVIAKLGW
jgi:prepilin-type N-terminal cleavage/methylation domain-containing protein